MRQISFEGSTWNVKQSSEQAVGPGPNYFDDSAESVFIDADGCLVLSIHQVGGPWKCSEVVLDHPLGFGEYSFTLESPILGLSKSAVCAAFLYENDSQEIDIEFSEKMVGKNRGQYVIQPGSIPGNLDVFPVHPEIGVANTSHSILWQHNAVLFRSWGLDSNGNKLPVHEWTYLGPGIASPEHARFIFNLWLYRGKLPKKSERMRISSFSFSPLR